MFLKDITYKLHVSVPLTSYWHKLSQTAIPSCKEAGKCYLYSEGPGSSYKCYCYRKSAFFVFLSVCEGVCVHGSLFSNSPTMNKKTNLSVEVKNILSNQVFLNL